MPALGEQLEAVDSRILGGLELADAYPDGHAGPIEHIQTHISNVFLTKASVYKLRKSVRLEFLDFSTRQKRNEDCLNELAVNRRFAPDVYLGVASLEIVDDQLRMGPVRDQLSSPNARGEELEHCVVMRRLEEGRDALSLLRHSLLTATQIEGVAEQVASFHRAYSLPIPSEVTDAEWIERLAAPVRTCLEVLQSDARSFQDEEQISKAERGIEEFLRNRAGAFERRRRDGRHVDGHGDLHLQHIWFEEDAAQPILIDGIEFRADFRQIDPASEVAFCAMDLRYRRRTRFAEQFLRAYAQSADDFDLYRVVDFYMAYRALVRAKVAALVSEESEVARSQREAAAGSARRHLKLAVDLLDRSGKPGLVVMTGVVGTGKSTGARVIAEELGGVVIASDRVRKHLAGVSSEERLGDASYSADSKAKVYEGLFERAAPVVESGRVAILDAMFSRAAERKQALEWALRRNLPFSLVETRCAEPCVLERLQLRERQGRDPSDAGPEFYPTSASRYEPTTEWPEDRRLVVRTDLAEWHRELRSQARKCLF